MTNKYRVHTQVQYFMLCLLAVLATVSYGEETYVGCLKNYSVLEQAVLEGDRYDIIKAFYPPENSLPSVFVKVTYVSTEDANIKERWLWTSVPIYLIQPPSVFQFISLLFSHHHISNRIRELTVHLPPACYNISAPSCHDSSTSVSYLNNKYLDVLTNEIYLFARYDGRNERITLEDSMPSTSMRLDNNCASVAKKSFYLYNTFCFICLPLLIYLLLSFIVHSIRPKLRSVLNPSLPKSNVNQNLAALVLTGLVFSIYVLICDFLALFYTLSKHELRILHDYEDGYIQSYTMAAIIIISIFDFIAFVISLSTIIVLFCLQIKGYDETYLKEVLCIAWCIFACKVDVIKGEYELIPQDDDPESLYNKRKELQQKANYLQRKERWILQKREEKRQQQLKDSLCWLEHWENELKQQKDQVKQWKDDIKLKKMFCLTDYNQENINEWESNIEDWEIRLSLLSDNLKGYSKDPTEQQERRKKEQCKQESQIEQQIDLEQRFKECQKDEDEVQEELNKRMFAENKAWLLLISFLAPLVSIGTHSGFVVMAWASDPDEASSLAVVFTLSFFYYFFGFRQLYVRISSFSCFKLRPVQAKNEVFEPIHDVSIELKKYHNNLREINLPVLMCELFFVPFFMLVQALIVFSYYYLPGPISSVPLNVMNLLQLVLFIGTGLITYKIFTFSAPIEEIILDKFVQAYRPQASSSRDVAEIVGETLGNALRRMVENMGRPRARSMDRSSLV